jgi:DNA primase
MHSMDVAQILKFMGLLRCDNINVGARWVRSSCPLKHLHSGGTDNSPSFAISVTPKGKSNANCLGCHFRGDPMRLLWRLDIDGKSFNREAVNHLVECNFIDLDELEQEDPSDEDIDEMSVREKLNFARMYRPKLSTGRPKRKTKSELQAEVPVSVLKQMQVDMTPEVMALLQSTDYRRKGRGLTPETIKTWGLGWHPGKRRICIPIWDEKGKLVSISGRAFDESVPGPKYLHSPFRRDWVLYGEHRIDKQSRTGYLFEGFFQVMAANQAGYKNTVAPMGSSLSSDHSEKIIRWFDLLIIGADGDKAGKLFAEKVSNDLGSALKVVIAQMPSGKDADNVGQVRLIEKLGPPNAH